MGPRKGSKDSGKDENDGAIVVDKDRRENDNDNDKDKDKEKEKEKANRVSFAKLFKYADRLDVLLMVAGTVGAVGLGVAMPLLSLLFGQLTNAFGQNTGDVNMLVEEVTKVALRFLWVALGAAAAAYMEMACWMLTGERQSARIRSLYLRAILRQEIGFFDKGTSTGEVVGHMSGDIVTLQEAIGEKVGQYLRFTATFIAGFAVAFASGWKLTLVMLSVVPLLAVCGSIMAVVIKRATSKGQEAYAEAGTVVEECIGAIRTVLAFAGETKAVDKYNRKLDRAFHAGVKQGLATGLGIGTTMLVMFSSYALALWYGSTLVATPGSGYTGGTVMTVLFGVIIGGMSLGQAAPNLASFASGQAAAYKIFQTIDRAPIIDSSDPSGETPDSVEGEVELHDVTFSYPARPDVTIFSGFSLRIPAGRSMALVGESGSGKSTVVSLLERFYDPLSGEVRLDGRDIRTLQLRWLRSQLALVSQEPVLFDTSIATNISYGKEGATQEEIAAAARMANIHSFIESLPEGYTTQVGERGTQLSGGQKQRIAIARAVLRNPRVLLLDEATSALDAESEKVVQRALDSLMGGRTTIIVAHRLSTVRNADCIAVLQRGKVVETGTHTDLISRPDGAYFQLVRLQNLEANGHGHHSSAPQHRHSDSDSSVHSLANGTSDGTSPPAAEDGLAGASGKNRIAGGAAAGAGAGVAAAEDSALLSGSGGAAKAAASGPSGGASGGAGGASGEETQKKTNGLLGLFRRKGKVQGDVESGEGKADDKAEKKPKDESFGRLLLLNKPEWPVALLGMLAACGNGLMFPIFSILLSNIITTLYNPDPDELRQDANFWSLMFVVLAASVMVLLTSQLFLFALVGSYLVRRVRRMCFTAVLRQEVAWFDLPENSSGAIGARLSTDAAQVRAMVGDRLSLVVQNTATIIAGLVIAFKACWQLSLVVLCVVPLLIIAGGMQISAIKGFSENAKVMYEDASRVANDAVGSIRTVAAFGAEERVLALYDEKCDMPIRAGIRKANVSGLGLAFANFVMFAAYSLSFWVGGQLVKNGATTFQNVFQVFFAIVMSAMGVAQSAGLAPDVATVQTAVNSIFRILDRRSAIDPSAPGKTVEGGGGVRGEVELRDVCFHYPSRPDVTIFDHLDLTVPAGKTVALVGESGSGKSTVIALVERFYDPLSGMVLLDGCDIRTLQLQWLRRQMALVSQEPTLFNVSIRENIAYGREGGTSEAEVVEAAKAANAHSFISALPDGYDTLVGERGVQLSGGQKQRVAIARAVLMDPRVLLLDEATSALDAESEKVVQDALERVMVGRTTIVIAHRLATIVNADKIAVFQRGRVVEEGSHEELVARGGAYASLAALQ